MCLNAKKFLAGLLLGLVPATALVTSGYLQYKKNNLPVEPEHIIIPTEFKFNYEPVDYASGSNQTETISVYDEIEQKPAVVLASAVEKKTIPTVEYIIVASTPVPTTAPAPTPSAVDPHGVESIIDKYAQIYGVSPSVMKSIAYCESKYDPQAVSSSGAYVGLFQFVGSTWASNRQAMGEDPSLTLRSNAEEAVKTAAFKMSRDGYGAWPVCSQKALASL